MRSLVVTLALFVGALLCAPAGLACGDGCCPKAKKGEATAAAKTESRETKKDSAAKADTVAKTEAGGGEAAKGCCEGECPEGCCEDDCDTGACPAGGAKTVAVEGECGKGGCGANKTETKKGGCGGGAVDACAKPTNVAKVEGVSDKDTAAKLQAAIAAVEGVASVKTCSVTGKAFIVAKQGVTLTEEKIKAAVEGAGFKLVNFSAFDAKACDKGGCDKNGCDKDACGSDCGGCGEKKEAAPANTGTDNASNKS